MIDSRFRACRAVVAAILLVMAVSGCVKKEVRIAEKSVASEEARAALAVLEQRLTKIHTVRAVGRLYIWSRGELVTDLAVAVAFPGRVRLEAIDSLNGVTMAAGAQGTNVWVWLPAKGKVYRGRASRTNLKRITGVDWEIDDLVHTLAGAVTVHKGDVLLQDESDRDLFVMADKSITVRMDKIKGVPLIVERTRRVGDALMPRYEVRFGAYRAVDDVLFPHRIVAHVPGRGSRVIVEYDDVELNAKIGESVFEAPR